MAEPAVGSSMPGPRFAAHVPWPTHGPRWFAVIPAPWGAATPPAAVAPWAMVAGPFRGAAGVGGVALFPPAGRLAAVAASVFRSRAAAFAGHAGFG